jgi:transposase-like protein
MFRERGFEADHSTIDRWVLAYAPVIEKRLRQFRRPHCGSVRIEETYIKIRGKWRYLYRAIDKHGNPVDVLLTAKRDLDAAKRFFASSHTRFIGSAVSPYLSVPAKFSTCARMAISVGSRSIELAP